MHISTKMRREIFKQIVIPEGTGVKVDKSVISIKGKEGEVKREFELGKVVVEVKEEKVIIGYKTATKREKKIINTTTAHIKNMIKGVNEKFKYKLRICSSHFPITVEIKGRDVLVKNFLGEKIPRKTKMPEGVDVKIEKDIITITSLNKELAGQAATMFEKSTRLTNRDRRVFQDGIYLTEKAGREI